MKKTFKVFDETFFSSFEYYGENDDENLPEVTFEHTTTTTDYLYF